MEYVLESESQQAAKYCDYYLKEYEFYIRRKELKEADSKLLEIEKLALEYGLDRYCGIVSYKRGVSFFEKKDYDSAQYNFLGALQVFMRFNELNCTFFLTKMGIVVEECSHPKTFIGLILLRKMNPEWFHDESTQNE